MLLIYCYCERIPVFVIFLFKWLVLISWFLHDIQLLLYCWRGEFMLSPPADLITPMLLTWAQSCPSLLPRYLTPPPLSCATLSLFTVIGVVLVSSFSKTCVLERHKKRQILVERGQVVQRMTAEEGCSWAFVRVLSSVSVWMQRRLTAVKLNLLVLKVATFLF